LKTVALVLFPGVQSLDVSGPMDVFAEANAYVAPQDGYRLVTIGTAPYPMRASNGQQLGADFGLEDAGVDYHIVLVAGGPNLAQQADMPQLSSWLRKAAAGVPRYGSICTGAFLLGRATPPSRCVVRCGLPGRDRGAAARLPAPRKRSGRPLIQAGRPTLVAAPTGSGKTLTAFLAAIDALVRESSHGAAARRNQVLYVSPLKALSNDIRVNLQGAAGRHRPRTGRHGPAAARHPQRRAHRRHHARPNATPCASARRTSWCRRRNRCTCCSGRTAAAPCCPPCAP
jgi:putative intracellular protease/amidase